jgi:hypothetical protein
LILFLTCTLIHLDLARLGWLYRYEAYLVALGVFACAQALFALKPFISGKVPFPVIATLLLCLAWPVFQDRAFRSTPKMIAGSRNIYEQQYQLGQFVHRFYDSSTVVLHDIGAVAFLSDAAIVDVFGLADHQVAVARLKGYYNPDWPRTYARKKGADVAFVYPEWNTGFRVPDPAKT